MLRSSLAFCVLVSAALTHTLHGQTFTFSDFSVTAGLIMNGSAAQSGNVLRVTPATSSQAGSCWVQSPMSVAAGFDTTFTFQITQPSVPGADGFAFVIQNDFAGTLALGAGGGELGYATNITSAAPALANCLAFELDTYVNTGELNANQISIHTNGVGFNNSLETFSIAQATPQLTMADGQIHTVRVLYVPGTLQVFFDNAPTPLISVAYDFATGGTFLGGGGPVGGLALSQDAAFVGFSGGTGSLWQNHDVLSWTWASTPPPDACFGGTVGQSAGGPYDVLMVNGSAGGILRKLTTTTHRPLVIEVIQPPQTVVPAPFIIWGLIGAPLPTDMITTPYGTLCLPPELAAPGVPWLFTLADNVGAGIPPLLPSTPTPWSITAFSGIPIPLQLTLQGGIVTTYTSANIEVTNAIILDVVAAPPPAITTVTPQSAVTGATVTINGSGFLPAAVVRIGAVPVPQLTNIGTQITFAMPAGVPCGSLLTVTNPDGQVATRPFNPTPTISNTVSSTGPAAGGASFIIIGSGFAAGTTVTIDGNLANVTTVTATAIVMTTPPGVTGPRPVVVTTPGGCQVTTTYTYL
jgi:hypothetical protein